MTPPSRFSVGRLLLALSNASRVGSLHFSGNRRPLPLHSAAKHKSDRKSTRLNSSHLATSYIYTFSLHDALPIWRLLLALSNASRVGSLHFSGNRRPLPLHSAAKHK